MNMENVKTMEQAELDKIASFEEAIKLYDSKTITVDELSRVISKFGKTIKFWDPKVEPNPMWVGNEKSRVGFKWSPFFSETGKFYQGVIKKTVLSLIGILHEYTLKRYDEKQFVYDDQRLIELDTFLKAYLNVNFVNRYGQGEYFEKRDFMSKIVDIGLGTIGKEDIYYRARMFDMLNKLIKTYPNGFPLTKEEKENIEKWH